MLRRCDNKSDITTTGSSADNQARAEGETTTGEYTVFDRYQDFVTDLQQAAKDKKEAALK